MAIDWLNPSDDILEARRVGREDRDQEVDELQAEVERLRAIETAARALDAEVELWTAPMRAEDMLFVHALIEFRKGLIQNSLKVVLCRGCHRALYEEAAKDGICLDCERGRVAEAAEMKDGG